MPVGEKLFSEFFENRPRFFRIILEGFFSKNPSSGVDLRLSRDDSLRATERQLSQMKLSGLKVDICSGTLPAGWHQSRRDIAVKSGECRRVNNVDESMRGIYADISLNVKLYTRMASIWKYAIDKINDKYIFDINVFIFNKYTCDFEVLWRRFKSKNSPFKDELKFL